MIKQIDLKKKIEEFQVRFSKYNDVYNCFISNTSNLALNRINKFSSSDRNKKLYGKLIAIKDNLNYINTKTTCGSKILNNYESIYNATVVDRVLENGGLIVGKTNMDEFAMGSSSEFSHYGAVKNNLNVNYVSGGSSGGSAVAVSSGLVDMALGSDTGGSVRQPASFCDIFGLKPTYGRLSRYGLVAFASSFDQVGIFANDTIDTALLFNSIAGHDENDSTSSLEKNQQFIYDENSVKKITIGIPKEYIIKGIDDEILISFKKLKEFFKKNGFKTKEISLPHTEYSVPTYYILSTAEASSNLARFDGIRYGFSNRNNDLNDLYKSSRSIGFGDEVKRRIILGTFVLSSGYYDAYYNKAQKIRTLIQNDFIKAFKDVDVIITPTSPFLPFKMGEKIKDPLKMYLSDIFTVPMSLAGIPALNIPFDHSSSGLPIGMQLVGNFFNENTLFNLSHYISLNK